MLARSRRATARREARVGGRARPDVRGSRSPALSPARASRWPRWHSSSAVISRQCCCSYPSRRTRCCCGHTRPSGDASSICVRCTTRCVSSGVAPASTAGSPSCWRRRGSCSTPTSPGSCSCRRARQSRPFRRGSTGNGATRLAPARTDPARGGRGDRRGQVAVRHPAHARPGAAALAGPPRGMAAQRRDAHGASPRGRGGGRARWPVTARDGDPFTAEDLSLFADVRDARRSAARERPARGVAERAARS